MITNHGFWDNFSLSDTYCKYNILGCEQSRRFLEGIKDNFLIVTEPPRSVLQLYLLFTTKKELGNVVIDPLVIKAWAVVTEELEYMILCRPKKERRRLSTLDSEDQASLFGKLVCGMP